MEDAKVIHETAHQAGKQFRESMDENEKDCNCWMAAFWFVKDGVMRLHRTTWNFPNGGMEEAMEVLRKNIDEAKYPIRPSVLRPADLYDLNEKMEGRESKERMRISGELEMPPLHFPPKEGDGEPCGE